MSVLIAGTMRVPPQNLAALKPHMHAMLAASRAEDGCVEYSYGEDVAEPGLIRVFEVWRDQAAIDAHFKTPHMAKWRAAGAELGVSDRRLFSYEVGSQRPL
ncbi:antibiotic biosynthesis monooxygenase [Phenylobacterium hankyongense]|uniref:Antibiotic biosynthesis monooxygenase n=1 Tax=Phenylobacterium hankyongense TaxID=1813876 RepID=A0A328AW54_9CAUL|nr:putative quinol monooxygenase [Phenylobacterium hankyongense]RAK59320.1 antibiotic biosynthesis monooxygenase [Phenylobacterium hankyongense]